MSVNCLDANSVYQQQNCSGVITKTAEQNKPVSFWDSNWNAGNFAREIGLDSLADWLDNSDKKCTDGKDDGSLSFYEGAKSFGKGLAGIIKGALNHPIATAVTIGAAAGLTVLTGGAALVPMVALGATVGATTLGVGVYDAITAENDAEAKHALEMAGNGTFALIASMAGAKPALNSAAKAGVKSAVIPENSNIINATLKAIEATPEALKMSGLNAKGNILTWTTGTLHAHSNALNNAQILKYDQVNEGVVYKSSGSMNKYYDSIYVNKPAGESFISPNDGYKYYCSSKTSYYCPSKHCSGNPIVNADGDIIGVQMDEYLTPVGSF